MKFLPCHVLLSFFFFYQRTTIRGNSKVTETIPTADRSNIWVKEMKKEPRWQQQTSRQTDRGCCCCWEAYREAFLHRARFWPKRRNRHADRMHFDLKTNPFLNNIWSYDTHTLILHTHRAHTPAVYSSFSGSLIKSQRSNIGSVSVLPPGGPEGIARYCILMNI